MNRPFHLDLLEREITKRKSLNPRYSMRAFSSFLDVGPSTLSRILNNSQELSLTVARQIIRKLRLATEDRRLFIASVAEEKRRRTLELLTSMGPDQKFLGTLDDALGTCRDLMFILDHEGRCVHANESAVKVLKLPLVQLIGRTLEDLGHSQLASQIQETIPGVFESGIATVVSEGYRPPNHETVYRIILTPSFRGSEKVDAVTCHWWDISESSRIEACLRIVVDSGRLLREKKFPEAFQAVTDLIVPDFADGCLIETEEIQYSAGNPQLIREVKHLNPLESSRNRIMKQVRQGHPVLMNPMTAPELLASQKLRTGSFICLPLIKGGEFMGRLSMIRERETRPFTPNELHSASDIGARCSEALRLSHS